MSELKAGDRVYVIDEGLARLRAILKDATGEAPPNHHGTIDYITDGQALINFDDGACAPYPLEDVRPLEATP